MSERRRYRAGDVVKVVDESVWVCELDELPDGDISLRHLHDTSKRMRCSATRYGLLKEASPEDRARELELTATRPGWHGLAALLELSGTAEPKPRRTLADVVANPPEGWTVTDDPDDQLYRFKHSREVVVLFEPGDKDDPVEVLVSDCTTLAKAASHARAVADLLDLLAEVSDV